MKKRFLLALLLSATSPLALHAQSGLARNSGYQLLDYMYKNIKAFYFDPTYGGANIEAAYKASKEKIKTYHTDAELISILGNAFAVLHDSHTYFVPPIYEEAFDYGFEIQLFGEQALVTKVKPGSSAEAVGLRVGDAVNTIDGRPLTRLTFDDVAYQYFVLAPREKVHLLTTDTAGVTRQLMVAARVERGAHNLQGGWGYYIRLRAENDSINKEYGHRWIALNDSVFVWKMGQFVEKDRFIEKIAEKAGKRAMVLDLRGNPGGSEETLRRFAGLFVAGEVQIGTSRMKNKTEPLRTKPSDHPFTGPLYVLIDSRSGSAAEVFARFVQLLGRGKIIGDRSAGAVRASRTYYYEANDMQAAGASVTVADLIMQDGHSLEGVGVQPNEVVITKNYNLAEHTDPVLAYALALAGYDVDPAQAAHLYERAKVEY